MLIRTYSDMEIVYQTGVVPSVEEVSSLYRSSGIRRPVEDSARIRAMYTHANLVVSAWQGPLLVGISRALTDFCYCCYVSDLAVRKEFQSKGIGKQLLKLTKEKAGVECNLVLLSAPSAMEYYPRIGMKKADNCFIIQREE